MTLLDSFATLAEADAFHDLRATPAWAVADDPAKSAALVRASDYITFTYVLDDGVERTDPLLKQATITLAVEALTSSLVESASADVVSEELSGVGKIAYGDQPTDRFPAISRILAPIVASSYSTGFRSLKAVL